MPDMTANVVANNTFRAQTQILELINNILAAMEEVQRIKIENEIKEIFDRMAINQVPWNEQLIKVQQKIMKDPRLDDDIKHKINDIIVKEYTKQAEQGYKDNTVGFDELKRTFNRSRLPKEDKKILNKIVNQAMYEMHDPHHLVVSRASYRSMVKLLNDNKLMSQVSAIQTVSGDYLFMYSAAIEPQMQHCAEIAALSRGILPRPDLEDIQAFAMSDPEKPGNIIKFSGLTEELAEKAVMESTKSRLFSFAKKENPETGLYDIYCYAGNTDDEKQKYYKQAISTLVTAAYSLTGPTGQIEKDRALHSAKEQEKIDRVIECIRNDEVDMEDSGYVFSIQHLVDDNNNRFILVDDYIQFGPEEFTAYYNGGHHLVSMDDCKDYVETLKLNMQSGPGQKVYISDEQMQKIREDAGKAYQVIENIPEGNQLDRIASLMNDIENTRDEIKSAPSEAAKLQHLDTLSIQIIALDAMRMHIKDNITIDKVVQRAIARKLQESEFKGYANGEITKETIDNAHICNAALQTYLKNAPGYSKVDANTPALSDVFKILEQANYTAYANELMGEIDPHKLNETPKEDEMTMDEVRRQCSVLDNQFFQRQQGAIDILNQISMELIEQKSQEQVKMPNTKNLHTKMLKQIKELLELPEPELQLPDEIGHTKTPDVFERDSVFDRDSDSYIQNDTQDEFEKNSDPYIK